jgi:hypothetical protein
MRDNSTGKNKEFYDLGKKMFDRINPVERVMTDANGRKYITTEPFKPDYNTEAVLVEEMQRMAKRIQELETEQDCVGWFGYDTGLRLWFETNKGNDGAIPLYKARSKT